MFQHEITLNWLQQKPTEQKKMRRHTVQRVKIYKICISPYSEIAIRPGFKSSVSNFLPYFDFIFAYVYMCAACMCLLPEYARRGVPILWICSYGWCEPLCGHWESNPAPMQEDKCS